jgi:hypothetical protein
MALTIAAALSTFWVHTATVERFLGDSTYGEEFDTPQDVTGFYSDRTEYSGGEIVAVGRFAFPIGTAFVPLQSRLTLPPEFGLGASGGPRVHRVTLVEVGNGGGLALPDHQVCGVI